MDELRPPSLGPTELAALRAEVSSALTKRAVNRILGAQLGPLINDALQDGYSYKAYLSDIQFPTLKTFVERYLPDLMEFSEERSGPDTYYRVKGASFPEAPPPTPVVHGTANPYWRTFAAVNPPNQLAWNK